MSGLTGGKPDSPEQRREKNNEYIKSQGIKCFEALPVTFDAEEAKPKSLEEIAARAYSCFWVIQIACDVNNGVYEDSVDYFKPILEERGLMGYLNAKEKRFLDGTYTMQDAVDMDWAYEALYSLLYALGFVDDIRNAGTVCDSYAVIRTVNSSPTLKDFIGRCTLRSNSELLEALDLYYRYDWAVTEKRLNPATLTGNLNADVVAERRRGLEWIFSDEADWYDISMDT
ncbi:MAG: DUF4272 domain-containing protein [Eubacteriaceae bacterium]|nr:DUF4272 domain-containing protein [Eubacteriaceae bacterium]